MPRPSEVSITPAMLAAYTDLKQGPLLATRSGFLTVDGRVYLRGVIQGLVDRRIAAISSAGRFCRRHAVLTGLGHQLRPEQSA